MNFLNLLIYISILLQGHEGLQEPGGVLLQGDVAEGLPDQGVAGPHRDRRRGM